MYREDGMTHLKFSFQSNLYFLIPAIPFVLQAPVLFLHRQPIPADLTQFFLGSVAVFALATMISVWALSLAERRNGFAKALIYVFLFPLLFVVWGCIDTVIRYINAPAGGGRGLAVFIMGPILGFLFVISLGYFRRMRNRVLETINR